MIKAYNWQTGRLEIAVSIPSVPSVRISKASNVLSDEALPMGAGA